MKVGGDKFQFPLKRIREELLFQRSIISQNILESQASKEQTHLERVDSDVEGSVVPGLRMKQNYFFF